MANIIDSSIFTDIIILQQNIASDFLIIDSYISIYEPEYLKHLLGSEMYFAFIAGKDTEPYKLLIDGDENVFEWNGQFYKFEGLSRMLGCLVYSHIIEGIN